MRRKIINFLKEDFCLIIVLGLYLIISIVAFKELGINYNLNSDDVSYIMSGINFRENHIITMHGVTSAQIMPFLTFLIAGVSCLFGKGFIFMLALKIIWCLMGFFSIIYLYKIIRLFTSQYFAFIGSIFLLTADFIWLNNIILTETPFILFLLMLIYYGIKLANTKKVKYLAIIIITFIICLYIRPNIGLYPIFLFIYLMLKKYDFGKAIKHGIIAGVIVILCLVPWIYRNYQVFHKFIPLTYGMGNPLLLGTYQGVNYPLDSEIDYEKEVLNYAPKELQYYVRNPEKSPKWAKYYSLEYDGLKAKYRMRKWWQDDKKSFLKSYLIYKPKIMLTDQFYWQEILGVSGSLLALIRKVELILGAICCLFIVVNKKYLAELFFILTLYGYHVVLYSYTFAYGRYAITFFPIIFIIIGIGLKLIVDNLKKFKHNKVIEGEMNEK